MLRGERIARERAAQRHMAVTRSIRQAFVAFAVLCALADAGLATEFRLDAGGLDRAALAELTAAAQSASVVQAPDARPAEIISAARSDYGRLVRALYDLGRYGAEISIRIDGREASALSVFADPARVDVVAVTVRPGPVFRFGEVSVSPLPPSASLPALSGETAALNALEDAVTPAIAAWRNAGHARAKILRQDIAADHGTARLNARITIDPGPVFTFGDLQIEGGATTRPERIREIAGLPAHAQFSPADIDRAAKRLRRTGTFRSVTLTEAEVANPDQSLDVIARIEDAPRRRIGAGAEYSTLNGIGLSGFWLHRNLRNGAERLRVDARIDGIGDPGSAPDYSLGTTLSRPATLTPDTEMELGIKAEGLSEPTYSSRMFQLGLTANHVLNDQVTLSAGVGFRAVTAQDGFGARAFRMVTLPLAATRDARDSKTEPSRGSFQSVALTGFAGFGGSASGARLLADLRAYRSRGGTTLAGRLQWGAVIGPGVASLAPDYLFYSGGGGSVRGQPYQSLGVTTGGVASGGRSLVAGSLELRHRLNDSLGLVAFADAGFVGATPVAGRSGGWHGGYGLGLRYATSLGPIRFDVARPVGGTGRGLALYFGIGQAF